MRVGFIGTGRMGAPEEFFNNPSDICRRMGEEAPLCYDEEEDFYALTRNVPVRVLR